MLTHTVRVSGDSIIQISQELPNGHPISVARPNILLRIRTGVATARVCSMRLRTRLILIRDLVVVDGALALWVRRIARGAFARRRMDAALLIAGILDDDGVRGAAD